MNWVTFDDPLEALQLWCVRDRIAADIVARYSAGHILWQLAWLPYRMAKNPSGLLVNAIVGNFPRPGLPPEEVEFVEQQLSAGKFPLPSIDAVRASDASFEKWKALKALCDQAMHDAQTDETPYGDGTVVPEGDDREIPF